MAALYDKIGLNYANLRQPDVRIAKQIEQALGDAGSVLNVGAGAGSYEPEGRNITAVEPSAEMIEQRQNSNATIIQGSAEKLPFEDGTFDAVMAVLTVHHWSNQTQGMSELRRVTNGNIVIVTFDPDFRGFWLTDYFPKLVTLDNSQMPKMSSYETWLGPTVIETVPIPHDCTDGFLAAYWQRPEAYLSEKVRAAMSSFWALGDITIQLANLENDLQSGEWKNKYGYLRQLDELDCGYRLVVA